MEQMPNERLVGEILILTSFCILILAEFILSIEFEKIKSSDIYSSYRKIIDYLSRIRRPILFLIALLFMFIGTTICVSTYINNQDNPNSQYHEFERIERKLDRIETLLEKEELKTSCLQIIQHSKELTNRTSRVVGIVLLIISITAAILAFIFLRKRFKFAGGVSATIAAFAALGSVVSLTLLKVNLLNFEHLVDLKGPLIEYCEQKPSTSATNVRVIYTIFPYITGSYDKLESGSLQERVEIVFEKLKNLKKSNEQVIFLLVVGSADKRPLKQQLADDYGSNLQLAQKRAEHIVSLILDNSGSIIQKNRVFAIPRGGRNTGHNLNARVLEMDRSVSVIAITQKKTKDIKQEP